MNEGAGAPLLEVQCAGQTRKASAHNDDVEVRHVSASVVIGLESLGPGTPGTSHPAYRLPPFRYNDGLLETRKWQRAAATPSAASAGVGGLFNRSWRCTMYAT